MNTPPDLRAAGTVASRDLDGHLRNRAAVLVDLTSLTDLPRTALSGGDPALLVSGAPGQLTTPAPLLRLLLRARSIAMPCALIAPSLGDDLTRQLAHLRVAHLWSAAVCSTEHTANGTNPYRAAADLLDQPIGRCLVVTTAPSPNDAVTSGARTTLVSTGGSLAPAAPAEHLTDAERQLAHLLALGHSTDSAATALGRRPATTASAAWNLNRRMGFSDRTRTIAHLIAAKLIDAGPLRAAISAELPALDPAEHRVLTLLATHDARSAGRTLGLDEAQVGQLIRQAVSHLGAANRTHAVAMLLLGRPAQAAASDPGMS
ncbi:hypothetical protein OG535_28760 [Kitasatospora sp. NBC_00085]|uniref:hypothetical protein n=1 Tax=Kitasatospora sp. NBC_00085 TaxID=2903566 RepID=UPI00324503BE